MARRMVWIWPLDSGPCQRLDWGYTLQKLTPILTRDRVDTLDGIRRPYSVDFGAELRVQVRKERTADSTGIAREFVVLESILKRGGVIGLANDRTKAFAAYATTPIRAGDTTLYLGPNVYAGLLPDALALAAGDQLVIESGNPEGKREQVTVSSVTVGAGTTIALSTTVLQDYDETCGVMVRHQHFYPALRLPADQAGATLVSDEYAALWTFEAELVVDAGIYGLAHLEGNLGELLTAGTPTPGGYVASAASLAGLIRGNAAASAPSVPTSPVVVNTTPYATRWLR